MTTEMYFFWENNFSSRVVFDGEIFIIASRVRADLLNGDTPYEK